RRDDLVIGDDAHPDGFVRVVHTDREELVEVPRGAVGPRSLDLLRLCIVDVDVIDELSVDGKLHSGESALGNLELDRLAEIGFWPIRARTEDDRFRHSSNSLQNGLGNAYPLSTFHRLSSRNDPQSLRAPWQKARLALSHAPQWRANIRCESACCHLLSKEQHS